jgi:hypothetical protein
MASLFAIYTCVSPMYLLLSSDLTVSFQDSVGSTCWKREVKFPEPYKGVKTVILASEIPMTPHIFSSVPRFHTSVLKSNLQKAVRRCLPEAAIATAQQMAAQGDVTELLRRLPIILLEDTLLNVPILSRWIWWMLADSKGWVLSSREWAQLATDLTCLPNYRDHLRKHTDSVDTNILTNGHDLALFSIWARSQWGGMKGDIAFLQALLLDWNTRGEDIWLLGRVLEPPSPPTSFQQLPFSVAKHGLPEAVDFHCCPSMLADFAKQFAMSEQDIQEIIWFHRSESNKRPWFLTTCSPKLPNPTVFAAMNFDPYVKRMWKSLPSKPKQTTLFSFLPAKERILM